MDQNREPKAQAGSSHNQQEQSKAGNSRKFETSHKEGQGQDMNDIKFYYALEQEELLYLKDQCTIWMPEQQAEKPKIWTSIQVIATCDPNYLFIIRNRIQAGLMTPEEVIWITVKNKTATGHIFGTNGQIMTFFRVA